LAVPPGIQHFFATVNSVIPKPGEKSALTPIRFGVSNNDVDGGDFTTPFGGDIQSGIGRAKALHAYGKFIRLKIT
jgi:hypothetical protein